jgi:hypothetical protein
LREAVQEAVRTNPEGDLARLRQEWQRTLLPGADEETFADAYAQLVAYGFLLARTLDPGGEPLSLERALEMAGLDHPRPTGALRWRAVRRYLQQGLSPQEVARRTGVASVLSLKD